MAKLNANIDELNKLTKCLKKNYRLRIGVLGKNATKKKKGSKNVTNGYVASVHEFGRGNNPERSFLYEPLKENLNFANSEMEEFKKDLWKQFFVKKDPKEFYMKIKTRALAIIQKAFATGGFGNWSKLKSATVRYKQRKNLSPNLLTATGQLKNSITGEIKEL